MQKLSLFLSSLTLFLLTTCTPESLYNKKPAFYSYITGDIHTDHIDQEYAADVYATPASCQKIITSLVALKTLGPDYCYTTSVSVTKKRASVHNLIISFSGDPTLTSDDLYTLLKPLENTRVKNNIIVDASIFKTPPHSLNLMLNDIGKQYAQPISSSNIDKNLINVTIKPTCINKAALVQTDMPYTLNCHILTTDDPSSFTCTCDTTTIHTAGTINPRNAEVKTRISPTDINSYIQHKISCILKTLHITGTIKIINNKNDIPKNPTLINTVTSKPLKEILIPALKKSDNFVFDTLYLTIMDTYTRAENLPSIAKWDDGDPIMKKLIKTHFSLDLPDALFVDGSGLSRYNRVQPKQLLALLKKGYPIPEFVNALATPGEQESTLATRTTLPCTIKAKTGTLTGVSCLCGYNIKPDAQKAFVIMASNFAPPLTEITHVIDTFINSQLN